MTESIDALEFTEDVTIFLPVVAPSPAHFSKGIGEVEIACGDALVYLPQEIVFDENLINETYKALFSLPHSFDYGGVRYRNELALLGRDPDEGVGAVTVKIFDGAAVVNLGNGILSPDLSYCQLQRMKAQIEATAQQFPYIDNVKVHAVDVANLGYFDVVAIDWEERLQKSYEEPRSYQNRDLRFSLTIPPGYWVSRSFEGDGYNQSVSFQGEKDYFSVSIRKGGADFVLDEQFFYRDSTFLRPIQLVDQKAYLRASIEGATESLYVLTQRNDDLYIIDFGGDMELSAAEQSVIESFVFID